MPHPYILMLEDDNDDRQITETLFAEHHGDIGLQFVSSTSEAIHHLENCCINGQPLPGLVIISKAAHAHTGVDGLQAIKSHPVFRQIPVIILSDSSRPSEVEECYRLGANSYIVKPASYALTVQKISNFVSYWFDVVELPVVRHEILA